MFGRMRIFDAILILFGIVFTIGLDIIFVNKMYRNFNIIMNDNRFYTVVFVFLAINILIVKALKDLIYSN